MKYLRKHSVLVAITCVVGILIGSVTSYANLNKELLTASYNGYIEIVKSMLDKGADVNAKDNNGVTALMFASWKGHTNIVVALLEKGADVNAKTNDGYTALMGASYDGYIETMNILLANGADVNAKDNIGYTALMRASTTGHTNIVIALLEKGADVNAKDIMGMTALWHAGGHNDTIKALIAKGTAVSEDVYVRYQTNLKNFFQSMDFDLAGRPSISFSFTADGSKIYSARGKEAFEIADIAWTGTVDEKTVARIPPGQKVHAILGSIESIISLLKITDERGFGSIGKTEVEKTRSTAEIIISGRYATLVGLKGVEGGEDGFLVAIDLQTNNVDVSSGITLGGRFKIRDVKQEQEEQDNRRKALEKIGNYTVEQLITALKDRDSFIRKIAVKSLWEIKDPRTVEPLIALVKDENSSVRTNTVSVLRKITGQKIGVDHKKWQKWWEENKEDFLKSR